MRIGIHLGHWERRPHDVAGLAAEAERAGFDSVWVSETWGSDATVLLATIAVRTERTDRPRHPSTPGAHPGRDGDGRDHARPPFRGRLRLGLGVSGPQVAEGWHGVPFDHPIGRTREYVEIVRRVLRRDEPITSDGPNYPLPLHGGSGKPLKANVRPLRADVPIFLAAMGPRNVALAAEIADGWIPFLCPPERAEVFAPSLAEGSGRRDPSLASLDVAPMVPLAIGPDPTECRDRLRPLLGFYGAMGSREANFYKDLVTAHTVSATSRRRSRRRSSTVGGPRRPGSSPTR